jgi:dihydrolipoamide dehydrogenase
VNREKFDFGIIGAGPAGYSAAIRASQLGKSVVLFEKENLGGVCLNKGCIPTKAFLHSADVYNSLKKISNFGINIENYSLDFEKVAERKEKTVEKLRKSLEMLLKSYDIEIVYGEAKVEGKMAGGQEGKFFISANNEAYECVNILVATGAEPKCVGGFEFDHEFILSSDDVLNLKSLPQKMLIAGSGAIGIEWARIFSSFGVEVSVVEIADKLNLIFRLQ